MPALAFFVFSAQLSAAEPELRVLKLTTEILTTSLLRRVTEGLDFHIHAWRQIELHQSVNRVRCRLEDVDQALVRAHLKLLAGLFVHVRRAKHGPTVDRRRKRNRPGNIRAGTLRRFDTLPCGLVQNAVIKSFQTNSNFVALSH